jgi:hypothetical protein
MVIKDKCYYILQCYFWNAQSSAFKFFTFSAPVDITNAFITATNSYYANLIK